MLTDSTRNPVILRWSLAHAGMMLGATITTVFFKEPRIVGIAMILSFSFYVCCVLFVNRNSATTPKLFVGRANLITLCRLITAIILLEIHDQLNEYITASLFLVLLCMDGLDGFIARKFNESSTFGQYLDMESDSAIVLILSIILWHSQNTSALILLAGSLRYSYVLFLFLSVKQQKIEPRRLYASTIAVLFNLALIVNIAISSTPTLVLLQISSILLVLSFSRSWFFQLNSTSR